MNWLHYLLEANLYLAVFFAGYYLFLRRETYYTLNRVYLLFSCVASFALPVIQLGALKPIEQPITAVRLSFVRSTVQFLPAHTVIATPVFTWQDAVVYAYVLGAIVFLLILLIKLYHLYKLTRVRNLGSDENYKVVYINQSDTAFSFFNYLFIGTKVREAEIIIKHELVHIRQKHSVDIIFIELLKIVNWFNPFIYLLQYSLREIHEFIADQETATSGADTLAYSSFLVDNAYGLGGSSITHSFFNYNLLKKRIIMLHQKRSGNLARLKYLLAIPICGGLLCASTLAFSKTYGWVDIGPHATHLPHRINPANKSPQVIEPVRRMLLTRNGVSTITDQFTATRSNGTTRTYTVHNISNKDVVALKKQGIIVNIISDVKVDSGKLQVPPPPPPAPPVKRVKFPLPDPMTQHTAKGYYYSEAVYTENGKHDIVVTFKEKDGSHKEFTKSKATAAELTLLKEKYGYVFPAHVRTPPPPPAPPAPSADRRPPPPPPFEHAYKAFFDQIARTIVYPKAARMHNISGYVILRYTLNDKHQISAVKIYQSSDSQFNASAITGITNYKGTIDKPSGDYTIGIRFSLEQDQSNNNARDVDSKMMESPGYSGTVVVIAASSAYNQLPPPPPPQNPFDSLYKYVSKTIRYPKSARLNHIVGREVVRFTIADGKIGNVRMERGLDADIDAEIVRVFKNYNTPINAKSTDYVLTISFGLEDTNGNMVANSPKLNTINMSAADKSTAYVPLDEVVIIGYVK